MIMHRLLFMEMVLYFIDNNYVRLPQTSIYKQGIVTNFEFFDFDGNGQVRNNFNKNWR